MYYYYCRLLLSFSASLFGNRAVPSQCCQLKIALRFLSKVSHGISGLAVQVFSFHWFTVLGFLLTKFTLGKSGQLGKLISSELKDMSSITLVVTMGQEILCSFMYLFLKIGKAASEYDIDVTVIYHGWSLDTDDLIQNHHLISQSHIYWIVWDMSISDNLAYTQRLVDREEKAQVYLQLPRKSSWKFHPKINHGVGLGLLSPFVCICVSSAARDLHYFNPFILFRSYYMQLKNINKCQNDDGVVSF